MGGEQNALKTTALSEKKSADTNRARPLALITGASRGIGKEIAAAFAGEGYDLALTCSKTLEQLALFAQTLQSKYGGSYQVFQADAGSAEDMEKVFSHLKRLDVLVNNAGISHIGLLSDMTMEQWHRVMQVNLDSCFYACRLAIPLFLQNHAGKIINISSVWGSVGASMEVAYSASKGGMNAFTKALAKELAPSNIQVNAIACGVIDTDMNACFSDADKTELIAQIPADRLGTAQEVAALVLQTAQAPCYMTGQILTIDGGWC